MSDVEAIARVHVMGWNDNYRGLVPDRIMELRTLDMRERMWAEIIDEPGRITHVAEDAEGAVCAFSSAVNFEEPHEGFESFLEMLYVEHAFKGMGLGRELFLAAASELLQGGCMNLALGTLRLGSARGFYERLGARLVPDFKHEAGELDDIVYGFDNLCALFRNIRSASIRRASKMVPQPSSRRSGARRATFTAALPSPSGNSASP